MRYVYITLFLIFVPLKAFSLEIENSKFFGKNDAEVKIQILSTADIEFFAPMINSFLEEHPKFAINYIVASSTELFKEIKNGNHKFDLVISSAMDLQTKLVNDGYAVTHFPKINNTIPDWSTWNNRVFAPSSLIFYLGINKKVKGLNHHNLFFDRGLEQHASEIYENPSWPTEPLFYVCCPSKTDMKIAPENCENIFILMPIAPELEDNETTRDKYFNIIMDRIEKQINNTIRDHIIVKKSYCVSDFKSDYNSFKGNAYGLANTLSQTAILKPRMQNKKIKNLFYTGQLTVPGPGVPPSIISGQVAAKELIKHLTIN